MLVAVVVVEVVAAVVVAVVVVQIYKYIVSRLKNENK